MRTRTSPLLLLSLLAPFVFALADPASAARPRDEGDGMIRLRSSTFLAGWAYDDDSLRVDDPGFVTETVAAQVEVGIAPRLTLTATVPFVWIPERAVPQPGDVVLGGLVTLLEPGSPVDLALALDVKLPMYESGPSVRGRAPDGMPAFGDGQTDTTASLVLAGPLPLNGGIELYTGYRLRTGGITDAVVGGGRAGLWLLDNRFYVSVLLDTVVTFDPATTLDKDPDADEIVGRGYAAGGPRVSIRLVDRTFLEVSALYVGRGRNSAGGVELGFGLTVAF